jgi:hypothetical protein
MSDNLTEKEIEIAYANAAKRRLIDDKDLQQEVVDMMQEKKMIPEELINEFKHPKEAQEQSDETEVL